MKLLECCLQTAANNFISSALNHLYLQYRFCPGISRFKPWWLGQDKTWKHLKAANFLCKTSWRWPREFLSGISTVTQTPIKHLNLQQSQENSVWAHLGTIPISNKSQEFLQSITYLFIHLTRKVQWYLKAYLIKREIQIVEITDFIEQNIILLQHYKPMCNPSYFMIPWCFILHWLDWEDRFLFVWKCSLQFTKLSSISTLKDLQDFFLNHSRWISHNLYSRPACNEAGDEAVWI